MARKLTPDEARIFDNATHTGQDDVVMTDMESFLRHLSEQEEQPLELSAEPDAWLPPFPRKPR